MKIFESPILPKKGTKVHIERKIGIYSDSTGTRPIYKNESGQEKSVAFIGDSASVLRFVSGPTKTHNIVHGQNKKSLVFTIQLDDGEGEPGRYVNAKSFPTPGSEETKLNSLTIETIVSVTIHVTILGG